MKIFMENVELQTSNFIKKRLQHRYFPMNITKYLKNNYFKKSISKWLVLQIEEKWSAKSLLQFVW